MSIKAEIVAIGSELLLGQIIDTNSAWIANKLSDVGINLYHKSVVGDNQHRMLSTLDTAFQRSDIVITSGGIGPTKDDITREVVAEVPRSREPIRSVPLVGNCTGHVCCRCRDSSAAWRTTRNPEPTK